MAGNKGPHRVKSQCLLGGVKQLHSTREYSDLVIKCGTRQWPVHKAIVCTQSSFFANACKKGWPESTSGTISLEDEREDIVEAMIDFFYLSNYDYAKCTGEASDTGPLQFSVQLFTAADKFDISDLCDLAIHEFSVLLEDPSRLPPSDFLRAVYEFYQAAPSNATAMRTEMVSKTIPQPGVLFNRSCDTMPSSSEIKEILVTMPSFGAEVVIGLSARMKEEKSEKDSLRERLNDSQAHSCRSCNLVFSITKGYQRQVQGLPSCPYCKSHALVPKSI